MNQKQLHILADLIKRLRLSEGQVLDLAREVSQNGALVGLSGLTIHEGDRLLADLELIASCEMASAH